MPTVSNLRRRGASIGGLLARSDGYSSITGSWSTHYYYNADGNGSPREITPPHETYPRKRRADCASPTAPRNLSHGEIIVYLVAANQTGAASYRYDPFGNLISSSGAIAGANHYRFSSKEIHPNSGMYYYLYRFYDPNLQRWINRDPLGDYGSAVYAVGRIERRVEPRTSDEIAAMADARREQLRMFTRINLNLYNAVGNDPSDQGDPEGLDYGFWNGLWDEFTDPDGYTACYADCMAGINTAADFGAELGGSTAAARKWYTWKYPKWFKAGGKYSKKLVPKLAGKFSACLAPLAIKDAWDCYQECKDRQ